MIPTPGQRTNPMAWGPPTSTMAKQLPCSGAVHKRRREVAEQEIIFAELVKDLEMLSEHPEG